MNMSYLKVSDLKDKIIRCDSPQHAFEFLQFAQANRFTFNGDSIGCIDGQGRYHYMLDSDRSLIRGVILSSDQSELGELVNWRALRFSLPPRICSILNVLPNEPFRIKDMSGNGPDCLYYINGDGTYETKPQRYADSSVWLMKAINCPVMVRKNTKYEFSDTENEFIRIVYKTHPKASIGRDMCNVLYWRQECGNSSYDRFVLPDGFFQQIEPGEFIRVSDYYQEEIPF